MRLYSIISFCIILVTCNTNRAIHSVCFDQETDLAKLQDSTDIFFNKIIVGKFYKNELKLIVNDPTINYKCELASAVDFYGNYYYELKLSSEDLNCDCFKFEVLPDIIGKQTLTDELNGVRSKLDSLILSNGGIVAKDTLFSPDLVKNGQDSIFSNLQNYLDSIKKAMAKGGSGSN